MLLLLSLLSACLLWLSAAAVVAFCCFCFFCGGILLLSAHVCGSYLLYCLSRAHFFILKSGRRQGFPYIWHASPVEKSHGGTSTQQKPMVFDYGIGGVQLLLNTNNTKQQRHHHQQQHTLLGGKMVR